MTGRSTFDEETGRFVWFDEDDGHVIMRGTAHRTTAREMAAELPANHPGRPALLENPDGRVYVVDSVDHSGSDDE